MESIRYTDWRSEWPEYAAWRNMRARCSNPEHPDFKNYGARGIRVCSQWEHSFDTFLADMGQRPSPEHTLERLSNHEDYRPGNCRWATRGQQARNRRSNRIVRYAGRDMTLVEACELADMNYNTVRQRLFKGWSIEKALSPLSK